MLRTSASSLLRRAPSLARTLARPAPPHRPLHATPPLLSGLQNIFDIDAPNDPLARPRLSVSKLTDEGFHLSDGLIVPGGVVFLDNRAFLWDVDPVKTEKATGRGVWNAWGVERFRIFEAVTPRPEILLLGTGATVIPPPLAIREYISSLGIQLDVQDSRNAASTFNLLSEEGRTMAAALMPLKPIDPRTGNRRR